MHPRFLLLAAFSMLTLPVAMAQHRPGPVRFSVRAASRPAYSVPIVTLPTGPEPAVPTAAIPTVRAAAAYAPLSTAASLPPLAEALPAPRRDLTGAKAGPPYDLYQNLPEEFRKRTLPAVWAEPLPVQLLRGALGR